MNEKENRSLIVRPVGAVEKAEPGAKRILSGMVADTLTLAKKEPYSKPTLTVLVGGDASTIEVFQTMIKYILNEECDLRFIPFGTENELIRAVKEQPFDLIVVYLWGVFWSTWGDDFVGRAVEVLARLKAQYRKPIVAQQGMDLTEQFKGTGVTFNWCLDIQTLRNALSLCPKAPVPPGEELGEATHAAQTRTGAP